MFSQSSSEIAEVYLKKSEEELKKKDLTKAVVYFDRATSLLGEKTNAKVEEIGTMIYYNLEDYNGAKEHAKKYFSLTKDKGSERYNEILFLYVEIEEKIEAENKVKAELLAAELLKQKEQKRLDSLTNVWQSISLKLTIEADTIYKFDKNNIAVFKNSKGFYGIIDDKGTELTTLGSNTNFMHYDGKIVLMEGLKDRSTKVTIFDTSSKESTVLPPVNKFNALSSNYGKVMLPRDNGLLVCYPNNSTKILVFDLKSKSFKVPSMLERYYDYWKSQKVIKKYNKENQIKIDKEYLNLGGDVGGSLAFYNEDNSLFGFITAGGKKLKASEYKYVGTLANGSIEAIKQNGSQVWLSEKGETVTDLINKNGFYSGTTIIKKVDSKYQMLNEKNEIMKGESVLVSLEQYLESH